MADLHEKFLRRYTAGQQSLFAYIRSKGLNLADSEDVLQDVSVALWESFASYDSSRPFLAWALGVARNVVHKHQRYQQVRRTSPVDAAVLDQLSQQVAATLQSLDEDLLEEKKRMEECIRALPEKARALLRLRYHDRMDLRAVAGRVGQSYAATNMLLSRIRARLLDCVEGAKP